MKKIVYLLAALIPAFGFTACDDHEDVPDVDFNVTFADNNYYNGELYVVQGDTLGIEGVEVINNEQGKGVTLPYVNYYFNYQFIGQNPVEPYGFDIVIPEGLPVNDYILEMTAPVFATDKAPGYAILTYKVKVVASKDEIPSEAVQSVISTAKVTNNQ